MEEYLEALAFFKITLSGSERINYIDGITAVYLQYCNDQGLVPQKSISTFFILAISPYVMINYVGAPNHMATDFIVASVEMIERDLKRDHVKFTQAWIDSVTVMAVNALTLSTPLNIGALGFFAAVETANSVKPPFPIAKTLFRIGKSIGWGDPS